MVSFCSPYSSQCALLRMRSASPLLIDKRCCERLTAKLQFLSVHSPVFGAMFNGDFVEKGKDEIEIKEVVYEVWVVFLKFTTSIFLKKFNPSFISRNLSISSTWSTLGVLQLLVFVHLLYVAIWPNNESHIMSRHQLYYSFFSRTHYQTCRSIPDEGSCSPLFVGLTFIKILLKKHSTLGYPWTGGEVSARDE